MQNLCVCCGLPIPEGRQVCKACEEHGKPTTADLVEVVRCKDCRHWHCGNCYRLEFARPTDFCSYGKRKDLGK